MSTIVALFAKRASARLSPEAAAAAAEAAAVRETAEARATRRAKLARTHLGALWRIDGTREAHRPTKEESLRRKQLEVLVAAYAAAGGNGSPKEWLVSDACRTLCSQNGWEPFADHVPAATVQSDASAPGAAPGLDGSGPADTFSGGAARVTKQYDGADPNLMAFCNAHMHKWAADGSHVGWQPAAHLVAFLEHSLNHTVPRSTASRWLAKEKELFGAGKGTRKKPDLAGLLRGVKAAAAPTLDDMHVTVEPAQTVFTEQMKAVLVQRCLELVDIDGFGPELVAALASEVYHDTMHVDPGSAWEPSPSWCYWFMHTRMGLVVRHITSHDAASPDEVEQQQRLHQLNVEYVAIALDEKLPRKFIMGSDEFGMYFFPSGNWKWEKKGAKQVSSDLADDKRQYTGDIVHNATGDIILAVMIFAGRTNACLPLPQVRDKFPNFYFDVSENHWANINTKKGILKRAWQWVCNEWARDGLHGEPKCIYFLDCWPVNLTQELRDWVEEACPGMRLRFIPAGATGKYQVNDTHLHKPLKDAARAAAQRWRLEKVLAFRRHCQASISSGTDASAAQAELHDKVKSLMGMKMLRSVAPSFLSEGCSAITALRDDGRSIIKKGWDQLYMDTATAPGFAAQARENLQRRQIEAATAAAYAAGLAAAAAAGGAEAGGSSVASVAQIPHVVPATEEDALVARVAEVERQWHEHDVATAPQTGKKRRAGKTAERADARNKRACLDAAAAPDAAGPASDAAAAEEDAAAACSPVTVEELKDKSNKALQDMCRARNIAISGSKQVLIARLTAWQPGVTRSNRGRRARADLVPMADAGAQDAEEDDDGAGPAEIDPWYEDAYDSAADEAALAAGLAAADELDAGYYM